jgi:hypothetical protein
MSVQSLAQALPKRWKLPCDRPSRRLIFCKQKFNVYTTSILDDLDKKGLCFRRKKTKMTGNRTRQFGDCYLTE